MKSNSQQLEMPDSDILDAMRRMSQADRALIVSNAHRAARTMITSHIRFQHPDWDDTRVHQELLRRMTGGAT